MFSRTACTVSAVSCCDEKRTTLMARQAGFVPVVRVGLMVRHEAVGIKRHNSIASLGSFLSNGKFGLRVGALLEFGASLLFLGLLGRFGADAEELQEARDDAEDRFHGYEGSFAAMMDPRFSGVTFRAFRASGTFGVM